MPVRDISKAGPKGPAAETFVDSQVRVAHYDRDVGTLDLCLTDDSEFRIVHAGHARVIYEKLQKGGRVTPTQRGWLERYRVCESIYRQRRNRLRGLLQLLRQELKKQKGPAWLT